MRLILAFLMVLLLANSAFANVIGADTQNFNPTTSGLDFVTVQSSETLQPGILNVGLFLNYAVNTLPNYVDQVTQSRNETKDSLLSSDVNFGLGLTKNWDLGFSFPAVLSQDVETDVYKGVFESTGSTEIRFNTKYRLTGDEKGGAAAIFTVNLPLTENSPFTGNENNPIYNLEFAFDTTIRKWALGFNLGYRFRSPGEAISGVPVTPYEDQYVLSTAASYLLSGLDTKLITEIYSSFPAKSDESSTDRDRTSVEWIIGIKHDVRDNLALHFGGGTELDHGSSSPDWRVYTGLNWAMGPIWKQKTEPRTTKVRQVEPMKIAEPEDEDLVVDEELQPAIPLVEGTAEDTEVFDKKPPTTNEFFRVSSLNFRTGSAKIPSNFKPYLRKLSKYLKGDKNYKSLTIHGHTDSRGKAAINQELSYARANTVKKALVRVFKMDAAKIEVVGHGESLPIDDNGNFQGRAKNRRVEFEIKR